MKMEIEINSDFADRIVVESLSQSLERARKLADNESLKYAGALATVIEWYKAIDGH